MSSYNIILTKEELEALLIQVSSRIDSLKELQLTAGEKGKIERVIELENHMKPIISGKNKLQDALYNL